jgi:hypothetical protein
MLSRSEVALLNRALVGKALRALEEEFDAFTTAKAAYSTSVTSQVVLLLR